MGWYWLYASDDNGQTLYDKTGSGLPPDDTVRVAHNGLQPVKNIPSWPDLAWFFTEYAVYESTDLMQAGKAGDSTWTALTTNGDFGDGYLYSGGIDPLRPDYYKYAHFWWHASGDWISRLDDSPTGSGQWEEILNTVDVQTAGPLFVHASAEIMHFMVDPATGYLWAFAVTYSGSPYIGVLKSTDKGDNWTRAMVVSGTTASWQSGLFLDVFNDRCVVGYNAMFERPWVFWTQDGNSTWSSLHLTGTTGQRLRSCSLHPASYLTKFYVLLGWDDDNHTTIEQVGYNSMRTELIDLTDELGISYETVYGTFPIFKGDPSNADHIAILVDDSYYGDLHLIETYTNFTSFTDRHPFIDGNIAGGQTAMPTSIFVVNPATWSLFAYCTWYAWDGPGDNPHMAAAGYGAVDEEPSGQAGPMPGVYPYTDSIPVLDYYPAIEHCFHFHYASRLGTNLWEGLYE